MTERIRRQPRHPIAKRYPAEQPPRIEMHVRRGAHDMLPRDYVSGEDDVVCDCFPRTSTHTIPSMFYDKLTCTHMGMAHIQPAQETQFNYPWTADSLNRRRPRGDDDDLSERLSLISADDDQLRFSPQGLNNKHADDTFSIATAPPYWYKRDVNPREGNIPPFTAPENEIRPLTYGRRAASMQDIKNPAYRADNVRSRREGSPTGYNRNSRLSNRQFTGNYVDPRSGKVYKYNVNYDGTPQPTATRRPLPPTKKPTTAT